MTTRYLSMKSGLIGICCCLVLFGCGGKDSEETVQEKAVENIIERELASEGKTADVKINQDDESFSITVKDDNDAESTTTMNVSEDGQQMNITGPEGNMKMQSGAGAKIPEDFPEDVPLYPGATIQMVMENEEDTFSLVSSTGDDMTKVTEFFKKSCVDKGWKEVMVMAQGPEMSILNYEKNDRVLSVMLALADGEVSVNITTGVN